MKNRRRMWILSVMIALAVSAYLFKDTAMRYLSGGGRMRILVIGDSLTGNFSIAPLKGWGEILKEENRNAEVHVLTMNGASTADILLRMVTLDLSQYRYVILLAGTNDAFLGKSAGQITDSLHVLVRHILKTSEPVIMIPPGVQTHSQDGFPKEELNIRKDKVLTELQTMIYSSFPQYQIVDMRDMRYEYPGGKDRIYTDGIHFTEDFHRYIAGIMLERVEVIDKAQEHENEN